MNTSVTAEKSQKKGADFVRLSIRLNWPNHRFQQGMGSCEAKYWDHTKKQLKVPRGKDATRISNMDTYIQNERMRLKRMWLELKSIQGDFTAAEFRAYVNGEFDPLNKTTRTFLSWVEEHVKTFDDKLLPGKTYKGAMNTKKKYQGSLKYLKLFAEETGEELTWANMDHEFVAKLKKWRLSKGAYYMRNRDNTDPVSHNTVAKLVKDVRGWITRARKQGIHDFRHTDHDEWSITAADPLRFALSKQQLQDFFSHPLPDGSWKQDGIRRVRDLFVVQCCVGQRISDLQSCIDQFNENPEAKFFYVTSKKTKSKVQIPVFPMIRELAERRGGKLPDVGAHQKYNVLLKKAAKKSGLFDDTVLKGGQMVPAWELMTSHVARRTFATMATTQGIPTKVVMAITGHKSEAVFNKYLVHNDDDVLEAFKSAGFGGFEA